MASTEFQPRVVGSPVQSTSAQPEPLKAAATSQAIDSSLPARVQSSAPPLAAALELKPPNAVPWMTGIREKATPSVPKELRGPVGADPRLLTTSEGDSIRYSETLANGVTKKVHVAVNDTGKPIALAALYLGDTKDGRPATASTRSKSNPDDVAREALLMQHIGWKDISIVEVAEDVHDGLKVKAFMSMELMDGDLDPAHGNIWQSGMPPNEPETAGARLCFILKSVAESLQTLHETKVEFSTRRGPITSEGVFHGDMKPDNLFFRHSRIDGEPPVCRIGDLGLAGPVGSRSWSSGTNNYCSPEQHDGKAMTGKSDVFGLVSTMLEIIVPGTTIMNADYEQLTGQDLLERIGETLKKAVDSGALDAKTAAGFQQLFNAMVSEDPQGRPTAGQVAQKADELLAGRDCKWKGIPSPHQPILDRLATAE